MGGVSHWGEIEKLWIPPLPVLGDGGYAGWLSGCAGLGFRGLRFPF